MSGKRTLSLSAYKKSKEALAVAPAKRLGFGESVSTREVRASYILQAVLVQACAVVRGQEGGAFDGVNLHYAKGGAATVRELHTRVYCLPR